MKTYNTHSDYFGKELQSVNVSCNNGRLVITYGNDTEISIDFKLVEAIGKIVGNACLTSMPLEKLSQMTTDIQEESSLTAISEARNALIEEGKLIIDDSLLDKNLAEVKAKKASKGKKSKKNKRTTDGGK